MYYMYPILISQNTVFEGYIRSKFNILKGNEINQSDPFTELTLSRLLLSNSVIVH